MANPFPEAFVRLAMISDGLVDVPEYVSDADFRRADEVFVATQR
jgi:hypothetical protein